MINRSCIMLKPASYTCNMRCKYCFYMDEVKYRSNKSSLFMNLDTFRNIVNEMLKNTKEELTIIFQGGEPTLVGLCFFKDAVKIVNELNIKKIKILKII